MMSWKEAEQQCQSVGAHLPHIEEMRAYFPSVQYAISKQLTSFNFYLGDITFVGLKKKVFVTNLSSLKGTMHDAMK